MPHFNSVLEVLTRPAGSLAYHLVILFAVEAMAGMALEEWRRMRRPEYRWMARGLLALLAVRAIWTVLEALHWRGALAAAWWIPFQDLGFALSWGIALWSFLPLLLTPWPPKRLTPIVWGIGGIVILLFILSLLLGDASELYGQQWIAYAWASLQAIFLLLGAYLAFLPSKELRIWLRAAFVALLLGQVAHLLSWHLVAFDVQHGWVRLAELIAFPLFALTVHQSIVSDLYSYGQEFKTVSEESLRQTRELLFMLETSKATTSSLDLEQVLDGIAENVVLALNADQCGIALYAPDRPTELQLATVYDLSHLDRFHPPETPSQRPSLSLDSFPVLKQAVERQQPILNNRLESTPAMEEIFRLLGSQEIGPLLVQPLVSRKRVLGLLLVGNARSKRPFSQADSNLCQALANQVAIAMDNARLYQEREAQARRLEELLRSQEEEREQSRALWEKAPLGILITDESERIIAANPAATVILGRSLQELTGKELSVFLPDVVARLRGRSLALAPSEVGHKEPLQMTLPLGDRMMSVALVPLSEVPEIEAGWLVTLHDITSSVQAAHTRARFTADVAQEMRTPLTSVQGYLDLLLEEAVGSLNPTQRQLLEKARLNAQRIAGMATDLVELAQSDPAEIQLHLQPTDIAEVIASSIVSVQNLIEEKKLTLQVDIQKGMPPVTADQERLKQVITHLLDNACKYTPPGGKVEILAETRGPAPEGGDSRPYLLVSVKDTGTGIPAEEQRKIFEAFYRAASPLSLAAGGSGLGLAVVKALVEAHGGRVWVESQVDVGSTFSFVLPLASDRGPSQTRQEAL